MLKAITWTAVLAGVASFTEGTDIWLNELKVSLNAESKFSIDLEFVGHPLTMEYPTPPAKLEAKLQFYNGDEYAGTEQDLELETSQNAKWGGNYVGEFECVVDSDCADATAAELGGVKVTYGEVSKVYCWGTTANTTPGSPIGPVGDGETCGGSDYILTGYVPPAAVSTFTDIALYDKALGFRGASANDDWEYKVSLSADTTPKAYDTLGFLNVCGDVTEDTLVCTGIAVQTIAAYTYAPPDNSENEDEVWLNELDITVGSSDAVTAKLELVGGPTGDGDAPDPLAVEVRFYSADAELVAATPLPVPMTASIVPEWKGHYVGTIEVPADRALAFPSTGAIGGIQLEWTVGETTTKAVYCWGTEAAAEDEFGLSGSEVTCQHVVKTGGPVRGSTDGSHSNRALFNWSGTTAGGGKLPKDFYWTDSKESDGTIFQTITTINACGTAGDCDPLVDQSLAEYSWSGGGSPPTESTEAGMWLNELKVTDVSSAKSLEVELVGQPLTMDYPTVPEKLEAKLQFYNGDENAGEEVVAELATSQDTKLGGNYLGQFECAAGSECAAASSGTLGGVKVTYGGVSKVYCWGTGATDGADIGPAAPSQAKCSTAYIVTNYVAPGADSFVDMALYDTSSDSGKEDQDWTWKVSQNTAATAVPFDTLGKVNVCEDSTQEVGECGTALVQTIAAYEYTEPPANTNTDEVWLNELDITVGSTGVTAKLEIVGGVTASTQVEVKFYLGNEEVESESDQWKPVELVASSKPEWNSHYVGTVDVPADLSTAFPVNGDLAGLQLKWGGKTAVYCWGSTAAIDSKLGEDEVQCKTVVKTGGAIRGSDEGSYNRALFNYSQTPANGGTSAGHFYWTDSKNGGAAFASIGDVNVCPADGNCIPTDQKLDLNGEEEVETPPDEETEETPSSSVSLFICSWRSQAAVVIGLIATAMHV